MSPNPSPVISLSSVEDYKTNDNEVTNAKNIRNHGATCMLPMFHERYKCMICSNIMLKPVQTFRGNSACEECYIDGQRNKPGFCPVDGEPIKSNELFRDKAKEKEILNLEVTICCRNKKNNCPWIGTVRELLEHKCDYVPTSCSLCNEFYVKHKESLHLQTCSAIMKVGPCIHKDDGCPFEALSKEDMQQHMGESGAIHAIYQKRKNAELQQKCQQIEQDKIKLQKSLESVKQALERNEEQHKLQFAQLQETVSELAAKLAADAEKAKCTPPPSKQATSSDVRDKNQLTVMTAGVNANSANISDLDLRLQLHENTTTDGHLLWKINDFKNRLQAAVTGKTKALHSSPCFTSQYGYKYCLRLYLNGDGCGKGEYVSLFLVIMRSEYDNVLQWPFQKNVKLTLVNQYNKSQNLVEKLSPNKDSSSFQQPKKDMNVASGCPQFVKIDQLKTGGFLKDDALFIDVQIS